MANRLVFSLAIVTAAAASSAGAGGQGQQIPVVKTGIEAIQIETTVVDTAGRPVSDLTARDFVVRVDGEVRPVTVARFYGERVTASTTPEVVTPLSASNLDASRGRVVLIVVDVESLIPGQERTLLNAAANLIDGLGPSDAVGLMLLPGPSVDLTRDHTRISEALKRIGGFSSVRPGRRSITVDEAVSFERGNQQAIDSVIERECRPTETTCPREIHESAQEVLIEASRRIQTVVGSLSDVIGRLDGIDAPTAIVVLSAGFPSMQREQGYFRQLQKRAESSDIKVYIVHVDQNRFDASGRTSSEIAVFDPRDLSSGLSQLAGVTDGQLFSGVGRATGVFGRIRSEVLNSYLLAIDARGSDLDGKPHRIDVRVARSGVTVRARKQLVATPSGTVARKVMDVIAQPVDITELPLVASAYSTRGEAPDTLKVVIVLESPGADFGASGSYAVSVVKNDQVAFTTADHATASATDGIILGAQLAPGRYRLRAAIVDGSNRAGSIDMPLSIGLRHAGDLQTSDLLLGTVQERFRPSAQVPASAQLAALIELYASDPAGLDGVGVGYELRKANEDVVVRQATALVSKTQLDRRRIAEGAVTLAGLAPGRYALSAILYRNQQPLGKITRPFEITAALKVP
jgi:VWFA-related protein